MRSWSNQIARAITISELHVDPPASFLFRGGRAAAIQGGTIKQCGRTDPRERSHVEMSFSRKIFLESVEMRDLIHYPPKGRNR